MQAGRHMHASYQCTMHTVYMMSTVTGESKKFGKEKLFKIYNKSLY